MAWRWPTPIGAEGAAARWPAWPPTAVRAVGAHGQTVRHQPAGRGYTLQLLNAARLAEADRHRRRRRPAQPRCGRRWPGRTAGAGLPRRGVWPAGRGRGGAEPGRHRQPQPAAGRPAAVRGFDSGPANALMDHWAQQHLGQAFDADGAWAAQGHVQPALLQALLDEPYFDAAAAQEHRPGPVRAGLAGQPGWPAGPGSRRWMCRPRCWR